jgi:hypothetical protein
VCVLVVYVRVVVMYVCMYVCMKCKKSLPVFICFRLDILHPSQ